jgi:mannose-1-phosphate guanylyltransferase
MKSVTVILAGGKGERFWPLSRENRPKQVLTLFKDKPMIVETYERLSSFDHFYIVANEDLNAHFRTILPNNVGYINEPCAMNTAPAIALACAYLQHKFGDCIVFFETADHYYENTAFYLQEIEKAMDFAQSNDQIVLIGINPTEPHTGYGYIQRGQEIRDQIYNVVQFIEKPSKSVAANLIAQGNVSWNSGMFISKTSVMLAEIQKCLPDLAEVMTSIQSADFKPEIIRHEFPKSPRISIDFGVLEKSDRVAVLNSPMAWDDIGDFNAVYRHKERDESGNVSTTKTYIYDSHENIILSERLVGLIGIENLAVIDTPDAILICRRDETQKIKDFLKKIPPEYK